MLALALLIVKPINWGWL